MASNWGRTWNVSIRFVLFEMRDANRQSGMSLVELLCVAGFLSLFVALVSPQLLDFSSRAKDAETKSSVARLRLALAKKTIEIQRHCLKSSEFIFPPIENIQANDISLNNKPCAKGDLPSQTTIHFIDSHPLPENLWGFADVSRQIFPCIPGKSCTSDGNPRAGIDCSSGKPHSPTSGGWCYDQKEGAIWANSSQSVNGVSENLF